MRSAPLDKGVEASFLRHVRYVLKVVDWIAGLKHVRQQIYLGDVRRFRQVFIVRDAARRNHILRLALLVVY